MKHVSASTDMDEDVEKEVENFKRCLRQMWAAQGLGCLFVETVLGIGKKPHTSIQCFAVPEEVEEDSPLYFKQALDDADEEWSQHKKIYQLTRQKTLRSTIPKNFAYFAVEWLGGGYAHVIEDEDKFSRNFGADVISGMLGNDGGIRCDTKGRAKEKGGNSFEADKARVMTFLSSWKPHDWTTELG
jgi:hypothetical protein